jgi:LysR family cys regulon transcriptional activator
MNFQQLRSLRETVRRGLSLTAAAEALHTSQPALSKQIRELEDELGVALFVRHGKKYTQLTEAGVRILGIAERVLAQADDIRRAGAEYASGDAGTLSIAATHTQARYALPPLLARFRQEYPRVRLRLHQGNPEQVGTMVAHGEAVFGLATEALDRNPSLQTFPAYRWRHCVVVPRGHPLAVSGIAELAQLAEWPLITYSAEFAGRRNIDLAFAQRRIVPDIVLEAIDSDVIKTYVALGFGIGLIAGIAYDPDRDRELERVELGDLLPVNVARLAMRESAFLRGFERRFVELLTGDAAPDGAADRAQRGSSASSAAGESMTKSAPQSSGREAAPQNP